MLRSLALSAFAGTIFLGLVGCSGQPDSSGKGAAQDGQGAGKPLYSIAPPAEAKPARASGTAGPVDPIVVTDCRLVEWDKQDVPSQRDGVIEFIGTDIKPGEVVPAHLVVTVPMSKEETGLFLLQVQLGGLLAAGPRGALQALPILHLKPERRYRRLQEGDEVVKDQLLGGLDDRLQRDEWAIKKRKITVSQAEFDAALKTRDEARVRYDRALRIQVSGVGGAISPQELGEARLAWERYSSEAVSKKEGIGLAALEAAQAETLVKMHEIRSRIPGKIKMIYKNNGDAVKGQETVLQLRNDGWLRVEGFVGAQNALALHPGMTAMVEYPRPQPPLKILTAPLEEITAVAVSHDAEHPRIVAAGAGGKISIWVWDPSDLRQLPTHQHGQSVKALACTPVGTEKNLCLSGATDGTGWLWDLTQDDPQPRALQGQHRGAINCVAFSPDGKWCATGGEDRDINLWDTDSGKLLYRFPAGHRGAVTAVHFTPEARLVSAGSDKTLRIWSVGASAAQLEFTLDRRYGYVTQPGVSPDGKQVLFDQGKALRVLSIPDRLDHGSLVNAGPSNFTTFALFSPDARLIVTAGATEGRVQFWRAPAAGGRGFEMRELVSTEHSPATCAAFAPDGSFLVTGTKDCKVLVWPVPTASDIDEHLTARLSMVEQAIEGTGHQVRIRADLRNPTDRHLLPGTTVTLVIDPRKAK
jgi:WD40 repeat protein